MDSSVEEKQELLSFDSFELQQPLREAITKLGFEYCTPIQAQSLVHTLAGHDITGRAQTGSGDARGTGGTGSRAWPPPR